MTDAPMPVFFPTKAYATEEMMAAKPKVESLKMAAQRFKILTRETNISTAVFDGSADSSVFNSPENALKEANENLEALITSSMSEIEEQQKAMEEAIEESTRTVKDITTQLNDLSKLPKQKLDEFLGGLAGGNAALQKSLNGLLQKCSTKGLNAALPGKPFDTSINCGSGKLGLGASGGTKSCNAGSYSDLLNKLTDGAYVSGYKDINSALRNLMALSGLGYDLGMCGVFGALAGNLPADALSRASAGLLSSLGVAGNLNGFLDVAKSSVALTPLLVNPGVIGNFVDHYTLPANVGENKLLETAERSLGGMELLDESWYKNPDSGELSWGFMEQKTDDLYSAFECKLTDRSFSEDALDFVPSVDTDFMMGSFMLA